MAPTNSVYFHQEAAAPFLVTRLVCLCLSVAFSSFCLWGYEQLVGREPSERSYFVILFSLVSIVEYSANTLKVGAVPVAVRLYWYLVKLGRTLGSYSVYLRPRVGRGLFYLICVVSLAFMTWEASIGWTRPTVFPEGQRDLVAAGLTLAVGIVAIFFTVLGLVIQRTMEDYSPSFVTLIARNGVYILFFILSLVTAFLDLWILLRGLNRNLVDASVAGSFYCVISVPFLILETFQNLDVTNVIRKIARRTVRETQRKIKEQPPVLSGNPLDNDSVALPLQSVFRQFCDKWISGTMRPGSALPLFDVPGDITDPLKERVRAITNTTLKAISLDQREVVLTCLVSMAQIVDGYAKARSSYEGKTDYFLYFINDQIQIIFNASLKSANEQYATDVTSCVADIAASTLRLTLSIQGAYPENSHIGTFCGVLERIAIQAFQLQHSDASPKACKYLGQIGISLIRKEAYQPVLYGVADKLAGIGRYVAYQDAPAWAGLVCQSTLAQLTSMLEATLYQTIESEHHYPHACALLLEKTEAIVKDWYEKGHGHLDNQTVIGPLVGSIWTGTKWTKVVAHSLRAQLTGRVISPIVEDVSKIVRTLSNLGCVAIRQDRTPQYEYFVALSEIAYEAMKFVRKSAKEQRALKEAVELVEGCLQAAIRLVKVSHSTASYQGYEDLFSSSAIWAFLIASCQETKLPELIEIYAEAIEQLILIVEKSPKSGRGRTVELSELYRYIKLFGAWLYRYFPRHKLNKRILLFLATNHDLQGFGLRRSSYSLIRDLGYPTETISEAWYVHPSEHWSDEQWLVTRELNHIPSYKTYDRLVRKIAFRLGTFVRFISRSIP